MGWKTSLIPGIGLGCRPGTPGSSGYHLPQTRPTCISSQWSASDSREPEKGVSPTWHPTDE